MQDVWDFSLWWVLGNFKWFLVDWGGKQGKCGGNEVECGGMWQNKLEISRNLMECSGKWWKCCGGMVVGMWWNLSPVEGSGGDKQECGGMVDCGGNVLNMVKMWWKFGGL